MPTTTSRSQLALRFFGLSFGLTTLATFIALASIQLSKLVDGQQRRTMPLAFWLSTALLLTGSVTLHRAAWHVRLERQSSFRRLLHWSLLIGTLFVGVQCGGLWQLGQNQQLVDKPYNDSAETGGNAFVAMLAGMHGVHFVVALLFVAWITVNAQTGRYDHEYSWSVTFCTWFWHTLGIVWLAILTLFAAGAITGFEGTSIPDPQVSIVAPLPTIHLQSVRMR